MAATIHPLFGKPASDDAAVHPMLVELRGSCLARLDDIVARMFDSADDALFEMGEKAPNDVERRQYFDTMRVIRIDRSHVAREFSKHMAHSFTQSRRIGVAAGGVRYDLDALAIQPTEELEEKIALGNLATKAEGLHKRLIWDIERRLEHAESRGIPVSPQALSPARICEALGAATAVLDTDFQIKLVIFKLFDRVLSRDLQQVYTAAIEILDREGIEQRRAAAPVNAGLASPTIGVAPTPFDLLRRHGVDLDALGIRDDAAGAALRDMLKPLQVQGDAQVETAARRLMVAGNLFNDLLSEPMLGDGLRAICESLRLPLYRTALSDSAFFTSAAHPVRAMLSELIELAAATKTGEVSQARFRSILQTMASQADRVAAVTASLSDAQRGAALTGAELDGFLDQLREQARARRNALLFQVRRTIAHELDLRTAGREVPKPVQTLLRSGVAPLMAVRLLRNGRGSDSFREAETLLEKTIATLDEAMPPNAPGIQRRERLIGELTAAFKDIGMAADRSVELLNGLRDVHGDAPDQASAAAEPMLPGGPLNEIEKAHLLSDFSNIAAAHEAEVAAASRAAAVKIEGDLSRISALDLLARVLTPESWFRVFDAAQNQTRWLKLASFHPERDGVTFTGFDESTRLNLRASRLADDLIRGQSEPINPTAAAREALALLRQGKAGGLS